MGKVLSKYEQYILKRDEYIKRRYTELTEQGTGKLTAYKTISDELTPPLDYTAVSRVLTKHGLNLNESKFGRKRKEPLAAQ